MEPQSNLPAPAGPGSLPVRGSTGAMLDPTLTLAEATEQNVDGLSLPRLVLALRRHKWALIAITLGTFGLSALWSWKADRIYTSTASVRIDDKESSGSMLKGLVPLPNFGNGKVMTEMEVLRSRQLSENVARNLSLGLDVTNPPAGRKYLQPVNIPESLTPGSFTLTQAGAASYTLNQAGSKRDAAGTIVKPDVPFTLNGAVLVLRRADANMPEEIHFNLRTLRDATAAVRENLVVSRPNREAELVNIGFQSTDPQLTAAVPNMLLSEFLKYKTASSRTKASSTVDFLRGQVASYESQLKSAEAQLGNFREEKQVVSLTDEAAAQVKRMAELHVERDRLQAEQRAIQSVLAKAPAPGETSAREIAAFPSFIANRGIQDILALLLQLETERNALLVRRNPGNADVMAVTNRIDSLNSQVLLMARGYMGGLDSKIAALDANIASFGKQVEQIPGREIAYARLARDQKLLEEISTLLNTRLKEAEIEEAVEPGDAQLIDRALVPVKPSSPNVGLNLFLGLFVGLGLGTLAAVGRDMFDTRARTQEDVQAATGGIPVLAAIPRFKIEQSATAKLRRKKGSSDIKSIAPGSGLITLAESRHASAEAYRALRTNLTFASADVRRKVIVMTSAQPGDGKSTTASNLALTLAQQGVRTLLIDADMRKGVLHKMFSMRREPGLSQVLVGEADIAEAVQIIAPGNDGTGLSVLTAGLAPPNPAELIGSARMRTLLSTLRDQYEMVIIDSPPLGLVTDAAILGTLADTTILVARAAATEKKALHFAAMQLYNLRVHVSGTIINDFDPKAAGYGYEYGYGYAYG